MWHNPPATTTTTPAQKHTFEPRLWTVLFESRLPLYVTFDWLKTAWWKAAAAVLWNYLLLRNQYDMMYKSRLWMQEIVHSHLLNQLLIIILSFVHTLKSSHVTASPNFAVVQRLWNCLCAKSTQPLIILPLYIILCLTYCFFPLYVHCNHHKDGVKTCFLVTDDVEALRCRPLSRGSRFISLKRHDYQVSNDIWRPHHLTNNINLTSRKPHSTPLIILFFSRFKYCYPFSMPAIWWIY